ncbi:MAG: shikimate dehydrogenase [Rhodospirillales bacterium]
MSSTDKTKPPLLLAGVMGWPIGHSRSPRLHGYWLAKHNIAGAYLPLQVAGEDLAKALAALPALNFRGCNLTLPHKQAALKLVDRLDPLAKRIGAVNTIVVRPDGTLEGRNSDAFGFIEALKEAQPKFRIKSGKAVVIGAGGAARAVVAALLDAGCPKVVLVNRSTQRAETLARDLGGAVELLAWSDRNAALKDAALLVNTTSQGMAGQKPLDLDLGALPKSAVVVDAVYVPLLTPLLAAAQARGNPIVDGLGMLLHQARQGFAAWFGVEPQVDAALRRHVAGDLMAGK